MYSLGRYLLQESGRGIFNVFILYLREAVLSTDISTSQRHIMATRQVETLVKAHLDAAYPPHPTIKRLKMAHAS